jgi:rRNA maturation protein Nop10
MKIEKPKFTLKEACPVCGQGRLLFLTCPTCGTTILVCDEEGSVFPNPKDLSQQESWPCDPWVSTVTKCPHCGKEGKFSFSTGEEIQKLGFSQNQYEWGSDQGNYLKC